MATEDPLIQQATELVAGAETNANTSLISTLETFPILREKNTEPWNFIMVVAATFVAATRLSQLNLEEERRKELMRIIEIRLDQWNLRAFDGFVDCKDFFDRALDALTNSDHERQFVSSDAIGSWIVWNIIGHQPQSDEERRLVRHLGSLVIRAFSNWWGR